MLCVNYLFLVLSFAPILPTFSAKILGVFLYPSRQHALLGSALFSELAIRGHEVTMISTFEQPLVPKKFRHVLVDGTQIREKYSASLMSLNVSMWEHIVFSNSEMKYMIAELLEDANLREFLDAGEKYDVVVSELFAEALLGISHRVNATTISFNPTGGSYALDYLSGNPHPYSYVPNAFTTYSDEMTFWQRFANTYINLFCAFTKHFFNLPMQRNLLRYYFPDAPPLDELMHSVDLHFVNSYYLLETPRPYLPNVVQIGGFHLQKPELLTVELLKQLDEYTNGIILFTVGSHRKLSDFPVQTVEMLFASFAKSPHIVLVQYDSPTVPKMVPSNVRLMPWLPQRAVLSHRNTKLFITPGGRSSVAEAIYFAVPMVGLHAPGDDDFQLSMVANRGFGVRFRLDEELREEQLTAAMRDVVADPAYKRAIVFESDMFKRQPMSPLDKAIYWIEYAAKHKGAKRVKSTAAAAMPLCKYILIDVIGVSCMLLVIITVIIFKLCKQMIRAVIRRRHTQNVKHKTV